MPPPYLYKTEQLAPLTVTLKQLHEMGVAFAESEFARKGETPFMWLIAAGTRIVWLATPWAAAGEKQISVDIIRDMLATLHAHAYTQIVEAWVAVERIKPGKEPDMRPPSERPENERDDVLLILSNDRDGNQLVTQYLVTDRKGKGLNFLGPRIDHDFEFGEGRMTGLFEP